MQQGVLLIVCGPSGVGKSSLCDALLERKPRLCVSTSYTTRAPRGTEQDGVEYHFVSVETFLAMRDARQFAEWAEVHGNYYGTAVEVIHDAWERDQDLLFDIDYQGARQLKERFPDACAVLVIPPDMQTLEQRLRHRATDTDEVIARRMAAARHEIAQYELFDFVLENRDFARAVTVLESIYEASRHRRSRMVARVEAILR